MKLILIGLLMVVTYTAGFFQGAILIRNDCIENGSITIFGTELRCEENEN